MHSIQTANYSIHFGVSAFSKLQQLITAKNFSKIFVLVDTNTRQLCLPYFLSHVPFITKFEILEVKAGEIHKTIESCAHIWQKLSDLGADRKSLLINLGGGVVTDMGGFIAATFKRGISFVNVPTTLLSMVDASIGGKTGVDLGQLKNQVGVLSFSSQVLIDTTFLQTLSKRELFSGLAEMYKHGLIQDHSYWNDLKKIDFSVDALTDSIYRSVCIKKSVVDHDPAEKGLRKILNFGHTLGHAIESYFLESKKHSTLLHGEAIAAGMIMEAYLSTVLTGLSKSEADEIKSVFCLTYPKVKFKNTDINEILALLKYDKKNSHGNVNFVLLKEIGKAKYDITVCPKQIRDAFEYYEKDNN